MADNYTEHKENWQRKDWQNRPYRTGANKRPQKTGENAQEDTSAFARGAIAGSSTATPYQPSAQAMGQYVEQDRTNAAAAQPVPQQEKPAIGVDQIRKAYETLQRYKRGKENYEAKIVKNEKWWKMRHWDLMASKENTTDPKPASGWLFNTIIAKHADFMDSFPMSNVLPREQGDVEEAQRLSSIVPVVMDQNGYRKVYSDEVLYKLKHGTGVFGVFWDQSKLNGLGDIVIKSMDILQLFWEPGVTDIQKSQNFFSVELVDNSILEQQYPQVKDQLTKTSDTTIKKYWYDETIDTTGKSAVIDWYYHKSVGNRDTLQYCKFVGDIVLYATENDTEVPTRIVNQPVAREDGTVVMEPVRVPAGEAMATKGLYDHAKYPFVFDVLFPEAGMPVGFGFVDVCKQAQATIDILNNCFEKNAQYACSPRYLSRTDGGINEEELANPNNLVVHVDGNLGSDSYLPLTPPNFLSGSYMTLLDQKITEMKETAGNRDAVNGGTTSGVTAASAIAAMQEASGKTSRDQITTTYEAHKEVVTLVIELIRQFYTMPRQFRITGKQGEQQFVQYTNGGLQPQYQGVEYGVDMGYRLPVFDVDVTAEKSSSYSRLSQNELALQFYNNGFFNPQYADQALACLDMMDFQGKDMMMQKVQANGGMYQQMLMMQQRMLSMAEMIDELTGGRYNMAGQMAQEVNAKLDADAGAVGAAAQMPDVTGESAVTEEARKRAAETTNPT